MQTDPRNALRHAQSPILLYTKLDADRDQQRTVVNVENTWPRSPSSSVVNSRPTTVAIYRTRRQWTCRGQSRVWNKAVEGTTVIFEDTPISLKHRKTRSILTTVAIHTHTQRPIANTSETLCVTPKVSQQRWMLSDKLATVVD